LVKKREVIGAGKVLSTGAKGRGKRGAGARPRASGVYGVSLTCASASPAPLAPAASLSLASCARIAAAGELEDAPPGDAPAPEGPEPGSGGGEGPPGEGGSARGDGGGMAVEPAEPASAGGESRGKSPPLESRAWSNTGKRDVPENTRREREGGGKGGAE